MELTWLEVVYNELKWSKIDKESIKTQEISINTKHVKVYYENTGIISHNVKCPVFLHIPFDSGPVQKRDPGRIQEYLQEIPRGRGRIPSGGGCGPGAWRRRQKGAAGAPLPENLSKPPLLGVC